MSSGGNFWDYNPGTISPLLNSCNAFEDRVPMYLCIYCEISYGDLNK